MIFFAIVAIAPLGAGCAGVGEAGEADGSELSAQDEAEIRRLSAAARMARLASLLRTTP
jgi:hypothetical protein